jgi:hypothetical protein
VADDDHPFSASRDCAPHLRCYRGCRRRPSHLHDLHLRIFTFVMTPKPGQENADEQA